MVPRALVVAGRPPPLLSVHESVMVDGGTGGIAVKGPESEQIVIRSERERSPTRLKRSHHKVRTGCVTCRRRRVKCDETHPKCRRCAKAGRVCEGYTQAKAWLFEPSSNTSPPDLELAPNKAYPVQLFEESDLNRPTQYFLECTAPRIAFYFAEMMDSFVDNKAMVAHSSAQAWEFWNRLVIQASETQPCVRYSLAAISSLHEWIELTKRTPWQNYTFTLHYTKAITKINQCHGNLPVEIILISCLLFAHCDFLMGASAAGFAHLKSGYRIISENRKRCVQLAPEISELIEPIIQGFVAKSENYKLREETGPRANLSRETTYVLPEMPEIFEDLTQANRSLQQAMYWVLLLELGQPNHLSTMTPGVRKYVTDWATAFGRWKARLEWDDPLLKDWQLLLLAHHRMALLILRTLPPENDQSYGRAAADFRIMYAQLRTFLRSGYIDADEKENSHLVLKVHLGFIAPLFFIATQCRVRDIRRNALEALQNLNVVEGHWNSCVAYAIAKTAVEVEEQYNETSPMKSTRIKIESVDRWRDGTMTMKYHKVPGNGSADSIATKNITEAACHHDANMQWYSFMDFKHQSSHED
ncbi:uncharacterized protein Z518_11338 [Rhinocladiella mackenziei CBS 650.93]|uniref:Zn(2)-C6 fungal-type domain-containing protein n=1 Tax=Rhinocladiella mackenziei CBS 650.93 TaxID=1442369 RepID=A0A0D2I7X9_9EURO|nr:uncharacterized protein Z518_11338 [Rhinocladiella mackenziei CBS 650.93]KIW99350.1 hypothetical protein Z518_11338 [Rhinocladiella mackenziei CBS 650.93]